MKQVLFVCTGNICRSPMAEKLFDARMAAQGWTTQSAGTAASNGWPASAEAAQAVKEKGLDLSDHKSQPVTRELLQASDYIFTMTERHKQDIVAHEPSVADRTHVVTSFSPAIKQQGIPDPIGLSLDVYRHTRDVLESAVADIILYMMDKEQPEKAE